MCVAVVLLTMIMIVIHVDLQELIQSIIDKM